MDGGAWWAAVHGVARGRTGLKRFHFHFSLSCIGEGNGSPLQCSCLENPRDRGAWWAAIYGVAQSQTRLKRLSSSSSRCLGHTTENKTDIISPLTSKGGVWQKINPLPKKVEKRNCVITRYKQTSQKRIPLFPESKERLTCGTEECWD